ncbi:glycosyltransferase, partial [Kineococcus siccus]|uniref:glycosyltransferase n=1 Tax=Kineococcus siccus TaxID=2696567 RepID=UPI00196A4C33
MAHERRIAVLQSFRSPRPTSNPYLTLLLRALPPDVDVRTFSWSRALLGRYDVLHLHWPELLLRSDRPSRRALRAAATAALVLRLRLARTAVVRTVHNPSPHEAGTPLEGALLAALDAGTTLTVHLSDRTLPAVRPGPSVVVPHGHYRDWYPPAAGVRTVPGRLLHLGLLRPYKNVDDLLAAFRATTGALQLRVVGAPGDAALADRVRQAAREDPRVTVELRHLDDAELAREVAACELVVLPYAARGGSGAQLLALSLDRPVLVPDDEGAARLAREVGPGWVHTFSGRLGGDDLLRALAAVRTRGRSARPDLSRRDWADAGRQHRDAYRHARALRRRGAVHAPADAA